MQACSVFRHKETRLEAVATISEHAEQTVFRQVTAAGSLHREITLERYWEVEHPESGTVYRHSEDVRVNEREHVDVTGTVEEESRAETRAQTVQTEHITAQRESRMGQWTWMWMIPGLVAVIVIVRVVVRFWRFP